MTEPIFEFQPWPKIARLNRNCVITEKLDGTNAAIIITEQMQVGAQSRKRLITTEDDNYGFARWVADNEEQLACLLGPGRHFGEWWGAGIQRRYGMTEKRFSLFNAGRWADTDLAEVPQLGTVPVLYDGPFSTHEVEEVVRDLDYLGSKAAPDFYDPEGVVVFLSASREMYKVTIKGDDVPKSVQAS